MKRKIAFCLMVLSVIFIVSVVFETSFFVHEGVHWIQFSFNPDIKPTGFRILPGGYEIVNGDYHETIKWFAFTIEAQPRYEMTEQQFFTLFNMQRPMFELQAYFVQCIFFIVMLAGGFVLLMKKGWWASSMLGDER